MLTDGLRLTAAAAAAAEVPVGVSCLVSMVFARARELEVLLELAVEALLDLGIGVLEFVV